MVQPGVAGRIGERVIIEVSPYAGIGLASTDVTANIGGSSYTDDGDGTYLMYGIKGGVFVKLGDSVELGLEVGYQGISADVEVEDSPDIDLTGDGVHAALVLGIAM